MKLISALRASIGALALAATAHASAGPILLVTDGILTGAKNVSVQGVLYDVTFLDGKCSTLFTGCNAVSDFAFATATGAQAASLALLDQVFVNGSRGQFDTRPQNTLGCSDNGVCISLVPYGLNQKGTTVWSAGASNAHQQSGDAASLISQNFSMDMASLASYNFAKFELSVAPAQVAVPEPTSIALVLLGIAGMTLARRRKS
ncbi:PEP-CTERM sorting domain-containing protein [Pseudoduganella lutea]|uniref:PEP-CTERM sorting domain-containing protein n=1 Tax=Pseudoduganella lutea TaxID=321985 RepID=A0A4P6KT07_9BURK|nr:PEP-CTERM sorting domain-containing protein [Pseudoduganella lutea]QBE61784.1 PEP-CTERM sorting domain-containing protein [Pseudoduganella lutea]